MKKEDEYIFQFISIKSYVQELEASKIDSSISLPIVDQRHVLMSLVTRRLTPLSTTIALALKQWIEDMEKRMRANQEDL